MDLRVLVTNAAAGIQTLRFNHRGAWYCSWDSLTSFANVGCHRARELGFVGHFHDRARHVEVLADFIGDFPDLTATPDHPARHPDPGIGYPRGQALALERQRQGHRALIYPSVRQAGGRCLVAFDPSAIQNIRPGARWDMVWSGTPESTLTAA